MRPHLFSVEVVVIADCEKSLDHHESGDLEEGEIEDGELPEEEEEEREKTNTIGKNETSVKTNVQVHPKHDKSTEKLEKSCDLPMNRSSGRRKNSHSIVERLKDPSELEEEWASVVEKQLKAAMCMDSGNTKPNGIVESSPEKSTEEDKKNRKKKRRKKQKEEEEEEDERRDSKRRKTNHQWDDKEQDTALREKGQDSKGGGGACGEDEGGDEDDDDEMLFIRGASPIIKGSYKIDASPDHYSDKGFSFKQGSGFDENYDSYNEDDSDFESREEFGRLNIPVSDDDAPKRGLGRGVKRRQRSIGRVVPHKRQIRKDAKSKRGGMKRQSSRSALEREPNICMFFMQGKCQKGEDCPYSHNACPPRKMELCKFYLMDCCAKKDKCLYMHHDFPCKFYHTGLKCFSGSRCKFSHGQLTDTMRSILLKHLETAPKELLGDFPRLSREGAAAMVYKKTRANKGKKIPSLFDIEVPIPAQLLAEQKETSKDQSPRRTPIPDSDNEDHDGTTTPMPQSPVPDAKSKGKSQRWNTEEISTSSPASHNRDPKNEHDKDKQSDQVDEAKPLLPRFYQETDEECKQSFEKERTKLNLHRFAGYSPNSSDDKVIKETAAEEKGISEDKEVKRKDDEKKVHNENTTGDSGAESNDAMNIPLHLPKKQRELFLRIQQQQREAESSQDQAGDHDEEIDKIQGETWYSSEDEEDSLANVLKNLSKQDQNTVPDITNPVIEADSSHSNANTLLPMKLPDFSKIDISESFTKLLSTICLPNASVSASVSVSASAEPSTIPTTSTSNTEQMPPQPAISSVARDPRLSRDPRNRGQTVSVSSNVATVFNATLDNVSTHSLTNSGTAASLESVRRSDPRRVNDPRSSRANRSELQDPKHNGNARRSNCSSSFTSIYSNAIMADTSSLSTGLGSNTTGDVDLRNFLSRTLDTGDVDLRHGSRVDTDLRTGQLQQSHQQIQPQPTALAFGDTDLRVRSQDILSVMENSRSSSDVDLRRMLELPFKPVPMHTPATEIKASLTSHPPIPYKVVVVTIPRPDYTSLKLNTSDPQVQSDPRLRKIFKLDSPTPDNSARTTLSSTAGLPTASRNDPRRQSARAVSSSTGLLGNTEQDTATDHYAVNLPTNTVTKPPGDLPLGISNTTLMPKTVMRTPVATQSPLLPNPSLRVGRDPRNAPGLLGPAPLPMNYCSVTPMFEDQTDSIPAGDSDPRSMFNRGAMDVTRWDQQNVTSHTSQNVRNNWRNNRRNQQTRYIDSEFSQGSFTPPI